MFAKTPLLRCATAAVALCACTAALAQKAGDTIVGLGAAYIIPHESIGTLQSTGPAGPAFNAATAGATVSIDSIATVSFSALHMFTDNIAAELSLGIPPKFTVDVQLQSGTHNGAATARELTPALVAKYLFGTPASQWRPYLGLGVTHASFSKVTANTSDPVIAQLAGGSASMSSSWAPVYNAGVIYNFDERWSLNASVSYIPLKTDVRFTGSGAGTGTTTTGKLTLNPLDIVVRVGYRF